MTSTSFVQVDMREAMATATMEVRLIGSRGYRLRTAVGLWLLRLAALVIGMGVEVGFLPEKRHVRMSRVADGLPRRLSSDDRDFKRHGEVEVRLDGELQADAVAYDADAGTVTRYRKGVDGRFIINGGEIMRETLEGALRVTRAA
jgi:hypothetical protein